MEREPVHPITIGYENYLLMQKNRYDGGKENDFI